MITESVFFNGVFYISLLLAILSLPVVISALMVSHRQMYRYRVLRSMDEEDRKMLPAGLMGEWNSVRSTAGYGSMVMAEVDRLNSLRPAILQASIAGAILGLLFFYPGYSDDILIWVGMILSAIVATVATGQVTIRRYVKEYISMAREVEKKDREDLEIIYS